MKRSIKDLTSWSDFEKELLKDEEFSKVADKLEIEFELADTLIKARKKQKLTQEELAKKAGTKQPVISRLERATGKPSFSLLERIAEALGMRLKVNFE